MIRTRRLIAICLAIVLLNGTTALACGPFTLEAVFVHTVHPAYPLERFAAGRIGVIQPSYARSYLYTAYRYLSGLSFTPTEQQALVSLWRERLNFHSEDDGDSDWTKVWLTARQKVPGVQARDAIDIYRAREKPDDYESYVNCNKDAFETAAATLNQRIAKYGAASPEIQNWLQAQDQVFANCSSGKSIPEPAPPSGDALLRADRSYQIAAANFYSADFDEARKQFETIAADNTSPWHRTAQFLVARALIRKGSLGPAAQKQESMSAAENQLKKVLADKNLSDFHPSATRLLNLLRLRLRPNERRHELAQALLASNENNNLKQDLWDYTVLMDQSLEGDQKTPAEAFKGDDLSDWIVTFQSEYAATFDHSLERWQTTRSLPWLIAALSGAEGKHARSGELISEAAKVKPDSPAFPSAQFHAVRLLMESGKNDEARTLLDQLLKTNRDQFDEASLNLLTSKRMLVATTLADFLTYAPRVPVTLSWNDDGREIPVDDDEIEAEMKALADQPRFDYDAGVALNRKMPLSVLKEASKNTALPASLRRDLVQAVWLRAVILGDTRTADELTPIVRQLIPELSTLLDAYLSATTPQAKRFSAIYAWLKFPGLEPVVDIGVGRRTPLQSQDTYRDNWWCGNAYYLPEEEKENEVTGPPSFTSNNEHELLFLSPTEKETAKQQWSTLGALGAAPNYISQNVIQWANRTPADPRVPEALHLAVMTTRFGCTDKNSGRWSKAAFDVLHRKYAGSTWAKKTPYWFNN
jgi:tetratricopeptide (TPR) repeat protein